MIEIWQLMILQRNKEAEPRSEGISIDDIEIVFHECLDLGTKKG